MTQREAVTTVHEARERLEIDPEMQCGSAEKAIVEHVRQRTQPERPQDRIAWIVSYYSDFGLVRVHVDDQTGEILEVIERV